MIRRDLLVISASLAISQGVLAQAPANDGGQRMQGGGVNLAPRPGVYEVISTNPPSRTVRLRGTGGRTADVLVDEDIYDIAKLKRGDRIQVDFVKPDQAGGKLIAASIWPVN